jgi:LPXTG-site transpeptidase (sortase) family protein
MNKKLFFLIFFIFSVALLLVSVSYIRASSAREEAISVPDSVVVVSSTPPDTKPEIENGQATSGDFSSSTAGTSTGNSTAVYQANDHRPVKISIPALSIQAHVQSVGITKSGNMATPSNYTDVGWYKYGPLPGEMGSAVIAGHRSNALFLPAVFYNLKKLTIGDTIDVTRADGTVLHFKVIRTQSFPYQEVPTQILFNESGNKYLKLVTCEGEWQQKDRTATERRIVTALLEP